MQPACLPTSSGPGDPSIGDYVFTYTYLEMILAQDEFLGQLSTAQRRALLNEALTKYAEKQRLVGDTYSLFSLSTTSFLMARIMKIENYSPFISAVGADPALQLFVSEAEFSNEVQVLDTVVGHAKNFN
jgi:hypothetical protein